MMDSVGGGGYKDTRVDCPVGVLIMSCGYISLFCNRGLISGRVPPRVLAPTCHHRVIQSHLMD